jgi:PAS domain S-box-containing protein
MRTMTADQLRMACEVACLGSFSFNLETGEIAWNNVLRQMLNISDDEEITLALYLEMVNEEDKVSIQNRTAEILDGKILTYEVEYRITPRGGSEIWFGVKGKVYPGTKIMYGIIQDITNHKNSMERMIDMLKETEASKENIHQLVRMMKTV